MDTGSGRRGWRDIALDGFDVNAIEAALLTLNPDSRVWIVAYGKRYAGKPPRWQTLLPNSNNQDVLDYDDLADVARKAGDWHSIDEVHIQVREMGFWESGDPYDRNYDLGNE